MKFEQPGKDTDPISRKEGPGQTAGLSEQEREVATAKIGEIRGALLEEIEGLMLRETLQTRDNVLAQAGQWPEEYPFSLGEGGSVFHLNTELIRSLWKNRLLLLAVGYARGMIEFDFEGRPAAEYEYLPLHPDLLLLATTGFLKQVPGEHGQEFRPDESLQSYQLPDLLEKARREEEVFVGWKEERAAEARQKEREQQPAWRLMRLVSEHTKFWYNWYYNDNSNQRVKKLAVKESERRDHAERFYQAPEGRAIEILLDDDEDAAESIAQREAVRQELVRVLQEMPSVLTELRSEESIEQQMHLWDLLKNDLEGFPVPEQWQIKKRKGRGLPSLVEDFHIVALFALGDYLKLWKYPDDSFDPRIGGNNPEVFDVFSENI